MTKILFMCVANSARSQMAEWLARSMFTGDVEVASAGSSPQTVNPLATQVLEEIGVELTGASSKALDELPREFTAQLDWLVTLCSEEVCPFLAGSFERCHWPFPDPAAAAGSRDDKLREFRRVRDGICLQLRAFAKEKSLPLRSTAAEDGV